MAIWDQVNFFVYTADIGLTSNRMKHSWMNNALWWNDYTASLHEKRLATDMIVSQFCGDSGSGWQVPHIASRIMKIGSPFHTACLCSWLVIWTAIRANRTTSCKALGEEKKDENKGEKRWERKRDRRMGLSARITSPIFSFLHITYYSWNELKN